MSTQRPYGEKRAHVLYVTRAVWIVVFVSLYPGSASAGTNPETQLPNDSDLNKIESALLVKWPNLSFVNMRIPIGDVTEDPNYSMEPFNIDVVRIRRDYYPLIPEIGDCIIEYTNQLLNVPNGEGEITLDAQPPAEEPSQDT